MAVQILIHGIVVLFSFLGMVSLFLFSRRLEGKEFQTVTQLMVGGIFFAVFLHSIVELLESIDLFSAGIESLLMNFLLAFGSVFFMYAGKVGLDLVDINNKN